MPVDYVLNGTVFEGPTLEPTKADIRVADGTIAEIAPPGAYRVASNATVIDAVNSFVLPGFVDCHDHLRNLTPGIAAGQGMDVDHFIRLMWDIGLQMGTTEYTVAAKLAAVQRLRAGITTVIDHAYTFHEDGIDDAIIDGIGQTGIRFAYARGIMTRPYEPVCETWEQAEARIRDLLSSGSVRREQLFVAPVSIRQASREDYRRAVRLADDLGVALYTHVAETPSEVQDWHTEYGTSPLRALDALGFLTDRTILAHCVWLEPEEIQLLASRGTHAVHCPSNHMKLGKGVAPVPELQAAGVNVALGVDLMADMLMEIRSEVGLHSAVRQDPLAVSVRTALQMATVNGGRALGWPIGCIAPGRAADLTIIDGRNVDHGPVLDPMAAVAYTANTGMITDVVVDGDQKIKDGKCVTVDESQLMAEAEDLAGQLLERTDAGSLWWRSDE